MSFVASTNISSAARPQTSAARHAQFTCHAVAPMTRVKQAGVALFGAALLASAAPAFADDLLEVGEGVFIGNCAACHAGGKNNVIEERVLTKAAISQYVEGGFTPEAITYQVKNGKGAMPAWGERLDDEEIEGVVKYVMLHAEDGKWPGEE